MRPNLADTEDIRTTTRAGWNFIVDPKKNINLRIGWEHRYVNESGSREPNDFDYFVVLGLSF